AQYDLIPDCVGSHYIRHDEKGDRTVTRDEYAAELRAVHRDRPGIRVVVYDHSFTADRAWFRFAFVWPDSATGEMRSRAGMQAYRIEGGK
ncbi:nuclear transport factor 2 family protein, partial [Pseudomonas sp. FW306-2-11AD]